MYLPAATDTADVMVVFGSERETRVSHGTAAVDIELKSVITPRTPSELNAPFVFVMVRPHIFLTLREVFAGPLSPAPTLCVFVVLVADSVAKGFTSSSFLRGACGHMAAERGLNQPS
jgi:hypothetical protein